MREKKTADSKRTNDFSKPREAELKNHETGSKSQAVKRTEKGATEQPQPGTTEARKTGMGFCQNQEKKSARSEDLYYICTSCQQIELFIKLSYLFNL